MDDETCLQNHNGTLPLAFDLCGEAVKIFDNQVSGRAEIISLNFGKDPAIGKPLNETERNFYETAAAGVLQEFIPCYKGVISIENGIPHPVGYEQGHLTHCKNKTKSNLGRHYIVLEDITSTFKMPSIMDLKMGTRQYSDTMSPNKVCRKKARSLMSTSNIMGLRVAGIRSYNVSEQDNAYFMCKMEGRRLTCTSINGAFRSFLHDGTTLRRDAITLFLAKLTKIIQQVEMMHIRLYCCSLLMVYESDTSRPAKIDVRIIDFAEFQRCTGTGERYSGPDAGFLLGLNSLVKMLEELKGDEETYSTSSEDISTTE